MRDLEPICIIDHRSITIFSLHLPYSLWSLSLTASNCGLGANLEEDVEKIHGCESTDEDR